MIDARSLLPYFLHAYPFQPATGIWRAAEIAALLNHGLPDGRGLDVGCGDGLLTGIIHERLGSTRTWIGIDPDANESALAKKTGTYLDCITTSGEKLPFNDNHFDFALSNSVLEHIPDLESVLSEVARVLKKGGRFVFTVPSKDFHTALRGPILPLIDRKRYLDIIDQRCAHVHYWNENEWRSALSQAGMLIVAAKPYLSKSETQLWETCSRFTGGLLYSLFGKNHQPIEIQRRLGMRKSGARLPMPLARVLARLLHGSLDQYPVAPFGCLLIDALKI